MPQELSLPRLARQGTAPNPVTAGTHFHHQKYAKCLVGGVFASSIRLLTNPLEVSKGYSQIGRYHDRKGIFRGLQTLWLEEGIKGLSKGVGPTAVAYACQTGTKYSLYEYFKDSSASHLGPELTKQYRQLIYVASAGCAEACADVLMCPWEQLRVKVQTSPAGQFPTRLGPALAAMISNGTHPFGALRALWISGGKNNIPFIAIRFLH